MVKVQVDKRWLNEQMENNDIYMDFDLIIDIIDHWYEMKSW